MRASLLLFVLTVPLFAGESYVERWQKFASRPGEMFGLAAGSSRSEVDAALMARLLTMRCERNGVIREICEVDTASVAWLDVRPAPSSGDELLLSFLDGRLESVALVSVFSDFRDAEKVYANARTSFTHANKKKAARYGFFKRKLLSAIMPKGKAVGTAQWRSGDIASHAWLFRNDDAGAVWIMTGVEEE
jgi:hypothetical protein